MDLPSHGYGNPHTPSQGSPRKSSAGNDMSGSGGLVFRGKTPRSTSQANAFAMDAVIAHAAEGGEASSHTHTHAHVQSPYGAGPQRGSSFGFGNESEPTAYTKEDKRRHSSFAASASSSFKGGNAVKSLLIGACLTATFFGILSTTGFFKGDRGSYARNSDISMTGAPIIPRRSLRGGNTGAVLTTSGTRILQAKTDHHHSRIIMVPSLEPFTRRNIHHYNIHDKEGKLVPAGAHRNDTERGIEVDEMEDFRQERREYVRHPSDVLLRREEHMYETEEPFVEHHPDLVLTSPYITTGDSHALHTVHGIDDHHDFSSHDYFGSAMTNMGRNKELTTVAVGAPGALETSGVIYFLNLLQDGDIDSYTYLTNEDLERTGVSSKVWGANTALGWAIENIGDVNGDGFNDIAVGALGYPRGNSQGAVFVFFLDGENQIKGHQVITTGSPGFPHNLHDNARFGSSITKLGDLDGDGVTELAVGAMGTGKERGGVYIIYLNKDGTVKKTNLISSLNGWDHKLNVQDQFGNAVRALGDLDGDGITELAVSGDGFPSGEGYGCVWVLFLNVDGSVKKWRRLDEMDQTLEPDALFGASIDVLGDLDGDGIQELLVGAPGMHDLAGEAYIVSLDKDAKVKHFKPLVEDDHNLAQVVHENDEFGWSVACLGDLDGDGIVDLAVAAETSPGYDNNPSIHMIFLAPQDDGGKVGEIKEGKVTAEGRKGLRG